MENTDEMFILNKYKYIRHLTKSAEKVVTQALPLKNLTLNNTGPIDVTSKV